MKKQNECFFKKCASSQESGTGKNILLKQFITRAAARKNILFTLSLAPA